jgi:hypothetical protein
VLLSVCQNDPVLCSSYLCVFWVAQIYHQFVSWPDPRDGSILPYCAVRIVKEICNALISVAQNSELYTRRSVENTEITEC